MTSIALPNSPAESSDMRKLTTRSNFQLAWERLERAREFAYKWYWRRSMVIARGARLAIVNAVRADIKNDSFQPNDVCLYSEPKPSSLLRHKSILSFGDHLLYQAIGNVVADRIYPRVKGRYGVSVFGNRYAGPRHVFFLEKWENGYNAFNEANRRAFSEGQSWLAQFDFASFYDSIGHSVLEKLLGDRFGVGQDVCKLLSTLLRHWSSVANDSKRLRRIHLDSGIPQGPLASPILAEAILDYIDEQMTCLSNVRYLRYADDIRIWGANEDDVRFAAAVLDRLSRNIGLFPQAKKFGIEKIDDVEEVIKRVSIPSDLEDPDDDEFELIADELQGKPAIKMLWRILQDFAQKGQIDNITEFKYLLGGSEPRNDIGVRLVTLIQRLPHLAEPCCYYIERIEEPSRELVDRLIQVADLFPGYPWLSGRLLRVLWRRHSKLTRAQRNALKPLLKKLGVRKGIRTDCQLQGIAFLVATNLVKPSPAQLRKWIRSEEVSWWALVHLITYIPIDRVDTTVFVGVLQELLGHSNREVSRAAAYRLCLQGVHVPNVPMDESGECKAIFKSFGLDCQGNRSKSRANHLIREILKAHGINHTVHGNVGWRLLLGQGEHENLVKYSTHLLAETRADRNLFIQYLDAAMEPVLDAVWIGLGCSDTNHANNGKLNKGRNGQVQRAEKFRKESDLRRRMPAFCAFLKATNDLRNHGHASHRHNIHTQLRNRGVSLSDVTRVLKLLPPALTELAAAFPET